MAWDSGAAAIIIATAAAASLFFLFMVLPPLVLQYQLLLYTPNTENRRSFIRIFAGIIFHLRPQKAQFSIIIHRNIFSSFIFPILIICCPIIYHPPIAPDPYLFFIFFSFLLKGFFYHVIIKIGVLR